jgi:hypothetical protein
MSWAFPPKKINQFLTSSQIGRFLSLGLKNQCFSFFFDFPWIGSKLGVDVLKISSQHSQEPTCKVSSQTELFWLSFDLFFLGSCCCFWIARNLWEKHGTSGNPQTTEPLGKTRNLQESPDRGASGKNVEPPGISRPWSLRGKTRSLRTCMLKICVWALRVLVLRSVFCIIFLTSQGSFSRYSYHQLAWVFWVENSLPLQRSWVSLFHPSV